MAITIVSENREEWVDKAKGLGIILVILGHAGILFSYIYSYHMPLFFSFQVIYLMKKNMKILKI